jgi:regulator of sigma E protease
MSLCLFALSWDTIVWLVPVVLKVAVGLGAVIFVHELGHFLVAKACGVKVEKFMIGFDIGGYKLSWRRGETEYGIGILPLGGYVKMLGQDDDPAHIKEQMEKSQIDANSANAKAITGPDGETYYIDRRSYLAKSVPQRMAIISAGVVMNIIFAFIFAAIAYGMGVPYTPCVVSETAPGSPAWRAGIKPGDEIIQIGDRENPTFVQLMGGVTLGDKVNGIPCVVRRAADDEVVEFTLKPEQEPGQLAMIGISSPATVTLLKSKPTVDGSAASRATLLDSAKMKVDKAEARFQGGDAIVRIGEAPIEEFRDLMAELARQPDKPLQVTVKRGSPVEQEEVPTGKTSGQHVLTFEVPTQPMLGLGLVMKMGPITAVQEGSPAAAAGILVGDVIESIDGVSLEASVDGKTGWTPDTLPELMRQAAVEGREVELRVLRSKEGVSEPQQVTIRVKPRVPQMYYAVPRPAAPQGSEALGIAYRVENTVHDIRPSSTAASANIEPGSSISAAKIVFPEDEKGHREAPVPVKFDDENPNWPMLMSVLQFVPHGTVVELDITGPNKSDGRQVTLTPEPVPGVHIAPRGFLFQPLERIRTADTFADQLRYGWDETEDALTMVVRFLQKLGTQVPLSMLGGPGTIAVAAGGAASQGLSSLLIFLTVLSANLAILNFLPIPLLDGGHMVFLAYEGIRGRPANEKFVVAMHFVGFVFIVGLMLFAIGLDIQRWLL